MTDAYTVPDNPRDPEGAALELIVRLPIDLLGHDSPTREALQEFTALLSAESVFAGMSWHDAKHAAAAIIVDATNRDDAAGFLRQRAERVRAGTDCIGRRQRRAAGGAVAHHRAARPRDPRPVSRVHSASTIAAVVNARTMASGSSQVQRLRAESLRHRRA